MNSTYDAVVLMTLNSFNTSDPAAVAAQREECEAKIRKLRAEQEQEKTLAFEEVMNQLSSDIVLGQMPDLEKYPG